MPLLNRLAANEYLVHLSFGLCRLWNALTLHTPFARRRRERSRAEFDAHPVAGRVQGQRMDPVARLPFGKYTMDYNGCEVIASYNALLSLGRPLPLGEVAAWYERHGLFLAGAWGTHVSAIPRFFRSLGYAPRVLYFSATDAPGAFDAAFAEARAAVFSFWNRADRLRSGVHTVAVSHRPGGISVDNLHGMDVRPDESFPSLEDMIRETGILPIVLTVIP